MKKTFTATILGLSSFFLLTTYASAQGLTSGFTTLSTVIDSFTNTIVKSLGSLFMGAAVVAFFYGIVQYVWGAREGNEKKIQDGNQFMIWGLVALFVMFSVYGIVKFGQGIFFQGQDITSIKIPTIDANRIGNSGQGTPTGGINSNVRQQSSSGVINSNVQPQTGTGAINSQASPGGATLIQESNGWKYYSDGTVIGPDGAYYYQGQQVTGAGGQPITSPQTESTVPRSADCQYDQMGNVIQCI